MRILYHVLFELNQIRDNLLHQSTPPSNLYLTLLSFQCFSLWMRVVYFFQAEEM